MKSVAFCTLGCKVNQYETDAMMEMFQNKGYEIHNFHEKADIYVINTCTVTNMADRKSRQMIHRAKKKNPDAVVVATGCYVQASEDASVDPSIDLVIGNNCKGQVLSIVEDYMHHRGQSVNLIDINHTSEYETLGITKVSEHTRAYIKIQDGCNQFCSYCIIPYARGRVRSREMEDILEEVRHLAQSGYKEIVLTGIHISSYGTDFGNIGLIDLVERLAEIKGIERIRFGSLEPGIVTEEFAQRLSKIPQICPHFHLSLQSGCEATLKRMNRHYTPADYKHRCDLLKKYFDRPAFTTDVIVGFPGETPEEFQQTKAFLEDIAFSEMHIFKYSPRHGTRAAKMPDQVPENIKTERSGELIELSERMAKDYRKLCSDKLLEVLIEEPVEVDGQQQWVGHSKEYLRCHVAADDMEPNRVITCRMTQMNNEDFVFCKIID